MAADRAPYEVVWWPHPHHPDRIMARITAYGVEVYGDTRPELDAQVAWAIRSRGG